MVSVDGDKLSPIFEVGLSLLHTRQTAIFGRTGALSGLAKPVNLVPFLQYIHTIFTNLGLATRKTHLRST